MHIAVRIAVVPIVLLLGGCTLVPEPSSFTTPDPGPIAGGLIGNASSQGVLPSATAGIGALHDTWDLISADPSSPDLDILVTHGSCDRIDGVALTEDARQVVVDVISHDTSGGGACDAMAHVERWTVHLASPLGQRELRHLVG
jgi:hypothetical protein